MIQVRVMVDNVYANGTLRYEYTVSVPQPAPGEDMQEWAYEHIFPLTGTGRTEGDAGYFAEIVAAEDPALIGMAFEWGV